MSHWKKALLEKASDLFEGQRGPPAVSEQSDPERRYRDIGRLKVELDWLKKSPGGAGRAETSLDLRSRPPAVAAAMHLGGRLSCDL